MSSHQSRKNEIKKRKNSLEKNPLISMSYNDYLMRGHYYENKIMTKNEFKYKKNNAKSIYNDELNNIKTNMRNEYNSAIHELNKFINEYDQIYKSVWYYNDEYFYNQINDLKEATNLSYTENILSFLYEWEVKNNLKYAKEGMDQLKNFIQELQKCLKGEKEYI